MTSPKVSMHFPGIREAKYYFPVTEKRTRVDEQAEEPQLRAWYIVGLDEVLVDLEVNGCSHEMVQSLGLIPGESIHLSAERMREILAAITDSGLSWTASLGYDLTDAIRPYVTAATQRTVITGQGGEVSLANVELGALNASRLYEAGIKGNFLDGRLFTAISAYRQTRTQFSSQNLSTNTSTRGKGIEFEARYVASDWLSLIGNSVWQDVINTNISPGGQFAFFNPVDSGIAPEDSFGGTVFGLIAGRNRRSGIPDRVSSLTAIVKPTAILEVFATVTDVAAMPSGFSGAVRLPGYTVVNLGSSVTIGKLEVQGFINNLFNERYFRANASDLFGSNLVLPERPRSWTLRLRYRF